MSDIQFETGQESTVTGMEPRRPGACNVVIFGATGDLAGRKLIPALYNIARSGELPERFSVVGVSRSVPDAATWRAHLLDAVKKFSRTQPIDEAVWERFATSLETVAGDLDDDGTYRRLSAKLAELGEKRGSGASTLFYLSTPSSAFPVILPRLAAAGLVHAPHDPKQWTRVIVEKPFGHDLESAKRLNGIAHATLDESQVFRIDHYLGKETVQNILVLRFGNSIFEPLWNHHYVDHVEITAAETIGIEGRGKFYEETGVMRDIVQNHLLQVLALVAMEPPVSFDANEIRDMKAQALRSLRAISTDDMEQEVVFGQYDGYRQEPGVVAGSRTPTFVAMRLFMDNWRWQGVPFYVRAGKALAKRATEVKIVFKSIPHCLFGREDICLRLAPNVLSIRVQPDEGIGLSFASKVPGEDFNIADVAMNFRYADGFKKAAPEAYERLLLDAMRGDPTLFARRDEVELAWKLVTPVLDQWERAQGGIGMHFYPRGSEGPSEAWSLPSRDGRHWEPIS